MINNSTSSLDTKVGYTAGGGPKVPASSPASTAGADVPAASASGAAQSAQTSGEIPVQKQPEVKAPDPKELQKQEELWKKVADVIPRVMKAMNEGQTVLDFKVAQHSNRVIITVIDKSTDKVIRQIPPEDVLRLAESIGQGHKPSIGGLLIDSKA